MGVRLDRTIVALHGFLGEPADWLPVQAETKQPNWVIPDYTADSMLSPLHADLGVWGRCFQQWLHFKGLSGPFDLVGYSQGGRLALEAFAAAPDMFRHLILVSAHVGMPDSDFAAREARRAHDEKWAQRFTQQSWQQVLQDWNNQEVFRGGVSVRDKAETSQNRILAAASLRAWSLSHQRDFRPLIGEHAAKIHYIAGSKDQKYSELGRSLHRDLPMMHFHEISEAGHRVPMEKPQILADLIRQIIASEKN